MENLSSGIEMLIEATQHLLEATRLLDKENELIDSLVYFDLAAIKLLFLTKKYKMNRQKRYVLLRAASLCHRRIIAYSDFLHYKHSFPRSLDPKEEYINQQYEIYKKLKNLDEFIA